MNNANSSTPDTQVFRLQDTLADAWRCVLAEFPQLADLPIGWEIGDSPHFDSARGFAVTRTDGQTFCLVLSAKMLTAAPDRQVAILRHELGHVLDFALGDDLSIWAEGKGATLPSTPERRADAVAALLWGAPIAYDAEMIQTLGQGTAPRPVELGD